MNQNARRDSEKETVNISKQEFCPVSRSIFRRWEAYLGARGQYVETVI
jgi:hypothetical protein